ncbi:MAG: hypothetical protein V4634_19800 [Pseudomonadota bacterium]
MSLGSEKPVDTVVDTMAAVTAASTFHHNAMRNTDLIDPSKQSMIPYIDKSLSNALTPRLSWGDLAQMIPE